MPGFTQDHIKQFLEFQECDRPVVNVYRGKPSFHNFEKLHTLNIFSFNRLEICFDNKMYSTTPVLRSPLGVEHFGRN